MKDAHSAGRATALGPLSFLVLSLSLSLSLSFSFFLFLSTQKASNIAEWIWNCVLSLCVHLGAEIVKPRLMAHVGQGLATRHFEQAPVVQAISLVV